MALDEADVELIRASWVPARRDSVGAGILLFRGLFTKFPDYLRLFNQFEDLNVEQLHENKRLVKHAVKVIETVTFVVDSFGDPAKGDQLNEALVALVRGHIKRKIGLKEFRNLGIVLIDFICDLNNRRAGRAATNVTSAASCNPALARGINSSTSSSQDSETMTSTLDKIRASSSSSSSSEDESLLARTGATPLETGLGSGHFHSTNDAPHPEDAPDQTDGCAAGGTNEDEEQDERKRSEAKLDAGLLVSAWTKLYGVILDLVKSEEDQANQ